MLSLFAFSLYAICYATAALHDDFIDTITPFRIITMITLIDADDLISFHY